MGWSIDIGMGISVEICGIGIDIFEPIPNQYQVFRKAVDSFQIIVYLILLKKIQYLFINFFHGSDVEREQAPNDLFY